MNKKDIAEIKKLFCLENAPITRLCDCMIDGEGNQIARSSTHFLNIPEEEQFKYFGIFKKSMSGTLGRNLRNLEVSRSNELLDGVKASTLKDDGIMDGFFESFREYYRAAGRYYVTVIHGAYDIPGKAKDGGDMFDMSDEVYEFILCSICPVELSKPGLGFDEKDSKVKNRERDWIIGVPEVAFLYPAFTDRSVDPDHILYYQKDPDTLQKELITDMLLCKLGRTPEDQKGIFEGILTQTSDQMLEYEDVKNILQDLNERTEEAAYSKENGKIKISEFADMLPYEDEEEAQRIREELDVYGDEELDLANITEKKFEVKAAGVTIRTKPEYADRITYNVIDGEHYIVIRADDIKVNGIPVRKKVIV